MYGKRLKLRSTSRNDDVFHIHHVEPPIGGVGNAVGDEENSILPILAQARGEQSRTLETNFVSVGCGETVSSFQHRFEHAGAIIPWLNFLPGLIGVLFAAPLILDFEHGTFRFAWTQSVPRRGWIVTRFGVMCTAALLATFALTELMTWFRGPLDHVNGRMEPNVFDFEGIVPYAYTLFALALVLVVGVLTRRAVTAGGIGLISYFALRVGLQNWGRKNYIAPVRKVWPAGSPSPHLRS